MDLNCFHMHSEWQEKKPGAGDYKDSFNYFFPDGEFATAKGKIFKNHEHID